MQAGFGQNHPRWPKLTDLIGSIDQSGLSSGNAVPWTFLFL
jgi:hypothetical protein